MSTQKQNTENNRIQNEIKITPKMDNKSLFEAVAKDRKNNELYLQLLKNFKSFNHYEINILIKILNCEKKKGNNITVIDIIRKFTIYQKFYPQLTYETVHKLSIVDGFLKDYYYPFVFE